MMEILGTIRKFFGYPWQKEWPKPPHEAQLYTGEGAGFFTYLPIGMATSRLIDFAFTALFQGQLESNMAIALPVELLVFLALVVLPFYLNHRDPKWLLWIWNGGAVLQRGTERIELTKAEVSQIKEVGSARLCLELFHRKKRYRLPLAKTANLLGLRHLLGSQLGKIGPERAGVYKSAFHFYQESIVIAFLFAAISTTFIHKQFLKTGETDILFSIILTCSTAFIVWKVYSQRPITVKLSEEGITKISFPHCFIRWEDVTRVTIDQGSRDISDSLIIEANSLKLIVPASTAGYWHLEQQILEIIPSSAQVTRQ
jgi:hypothetical protein